MLRELFTAIKVMAKAGEDECDRITMNDDYGKKFQQKQQKQQIQIKKMKPYIKDSRSSTELTGFDFGQDGSNENFINRRFNDIDYPETYPVVNKHEMAKMIAQAERRAFEAECRAEAEAEAARLFEAECRAAEAERRAQVAKKFRQMQDDALENPYVRDITSYEERGVTKLR